MEQLLALALSAAVLLPPWPLSPDGELVAFRGAEALTAQGAEIEPVGPGLCRVRPAPGVTRVVLTAGDARVEAAVEAPPGTIELEATPPAPVKGRDASVALRLTVRDAAGALDEAAAPPEIVASSGRVVELAGDGPGRFRARYEPARARYPEVAVLFALSPRCAQCATPRAVGALILPLAAAIDLPGESEPGTRTTVAIGGRTFGPVVAGDDGRFRVPIVVPPGSRATALSVDALGNTKRTELDLGLPQVDRLACAAWPRALAADGRAEAFLWCAAAEAAGEPARSPELQLKATAGELGPLAEVHPGLLRARFRAPRGAGPGEARLLVSYPAGGPASRDEQAIALGKGGPERLDVALAREPVIPGEVVAVESGVFDRTGERLGAPHGPEGAREGFVAADRFVARRAPGDWTQRATLAFALPPARPAELASLALRRRTDAWVAEARAHDGRPVTGVRLRFGSGAEATTDAAGEARTPATGPAETVAAVAPAAEGARAAGWEGVEPPSAPVALSRELTVRLRAPSPVDLEARVEGRTLRWRLRDASGAPVPARAVVLRAAGVEVGTPEPDGEGGKARLGPGKGSVAVVDADTGVAAVVEVP
ncbi:MAG: hypothetical protein U0229_03770 [Anaeromyxobacter sp.]